MIDPTKKIEWLDTDGEWKEATTLRFTRDFAFVTLTDGWPYVVHSDGIAFYLSDYGKTIQTSIEFRNRPPVPAPQPDSVEIARRIASSSGVIDANDFREFCGAFAAEQTRQRKAAGELARLSKLVAADWGDGLYQDEWNALAADAETRSGGAK